jgi:hypothetical protein
MDPRRFAPATARNREPILSVLSRVVREGSFVLEVSSGTGEHAVFFAEKLPRVTWQPSDPDPQARASIDAFRADAALENVLPALDLDVEAERWPVECADAVLNINMIHIAPPAACEHLLRGAARILSAGAPLYLYGPFKVKGAHTAPSNARFDDDLRARNPAWGLRNLDDVIALAQNRGFAHDETVPMPANNLSVVLRRV